MHLPVYGITLDVALASIGFLPIITLQCMSLMSFMSLMLHLLAVIHVILVTGFILLNRKQHFVTVFGR